MTSSPSVGASGGPEGYDPHQFPPRAVTVDIAVFTVRERAARAARPEAAERQRVLQVLMLERADDAEVFGGLLSLPGSFVGDEANLAQAASRILREKADLDLPLHALEQFGAYGDPDRDPRMRVISIGFIARVSEESAPNDEFADRSIDQLAQRRSDRWRWCEVEGLLDDDMRSLAFDHAEILRDALDHLRTAVEETDAALDLLPEVFTLKQLRETYEAIWGTKIDPGNFAKRVARLEGFLTDREEPEFRSDPGPEVLTDRWVVFDPPTDSRSDSSADSPADPPVMFMSAPRLQRLEHRMRVDDGASEPTRAARGRGRPPRWFSRGSASLLHPPLRRPGSYRSRPGSG